MNTVLLSILGLLALSSHALGIVCPANYCDDVTCEAVTQENCDGKIVENGTFCGCCDACRAILNEGDYCATFITQGLPPTSECDTGLVCSFSTFRCERE